MPLDISGFLCGDRHVCLRNERWPVVPDRTALVFQSLFANGTRDQKRQG